MQLSFIQVIFTHYYLNLAKTGVYGTQLRNTGLDVNIWEGASFSFFVQLIFMALIKLDKTH